MSVIILSGQYVSQELTVEFGAVPPALLPVGNKRLYNYQIDNIRKSRAEGKIYLSLPSQYTLTSWDAEELKKADVEIIWVGEEFTLGQSISYCLSSISDTHEDVTIYYGDTLFRNPLSKSTDVAYIAKPDHNYLWLPLREDERQPADTVFCGVLNVSKPILFIKSLIQSGFDLEQGFQKYNETLPIKREVREDWLDFGHLNTYFNSKTIVTTERAFNSLRINKNYVTKWSQKNNKLKAEALWFDSVPEELTHFTPRLVAHGEKDDQFFYKLEYLYHPTLTELFVFGDQPKTVWRRIISSCFDFVEQCAAIRPEQKADSKFYHQLVEKNKERLVDFIEHNPRFSQTIADSEGREFVLIDLLDRCHQLINPESSLSFVHGDFCFSNILFDFRKNDIRVIDPRGMSFDGEITSYGDIRYDLAKLLHSAIGKYDFIVSDLFSVSDDGYHLSLNIPQQMTVLDDLVKARLSVMGFSVNEILAITCTLFLSMLPLHYDKPQRQLAFIATAINLYKEIE
ncbi:phosphotransferase [Chromobacterium subtsugae]|uniref:phosphotransferase n=1 Tax=Chromobacterium subtsugae TaxID=251747 RepID=UPI000640CF73|nr:phosphotransferase [Chromobacterium subtsugae]